MSIADKIVLKFAKLSDEQKNDAATKVLNNIKSNGDVEKDIDFGDIEFEEKPEESTEDAESLDLMDELSALSEEIESIKEDGKVDSFEVVGLFQNMMDMVTELLRAKPGRKPRKKANVEDRVVFNFQAARGLQIKRKDKDLMSDTGGTSKTREREPDKKPPREDMKKPFRKKDKRAPERDTDTDNDKDMKKSSIRLLSRRTR